ncbi:MAG: TonB-dependent receptor [Bryobacteraceae bacterium]
MFRLLAFLAALSLLPILPISAQEARGRILGRVTDSSGAVVAEALVLITNTATNQVATVTTNEQGNFQAPFLIPGRYSVQVEKPGFRRVLRDNIEVRVDDRLEINVSLEVGEVAETVNVSAEAPLLETSSPSLGQVVDSRRVAELPLAHGVPFHLIALAPGAMNAAPHSRFDQPYAPSYMAAYAIDGTRSGRNELTLDGVPNTSTGGANEVISSYVPPADIVAEFKVQTASFDASVGQTEGGVVNVSLKSGTNQLHGTAQYVKMDPVLEANSFLANKAGQPKGDYSYDRWGATLHGPIVIPKLYDGHNRSFFLYGYEAINTKYPRGTQLTVPTEKQRQGDFSELLRLGSSYQIYDPMTRRAAPNGRFQSDPFPGNIIPATRISPVASAILNYYPLPTAAGTADGRNNLPLLTKTEDLTYYTHTARVDQYVSEKYRMFVRANVYKRQSYYDDWFENAATGSGFEFLSRGAAFDHVYTFSPTLVMNVRYGFNRFVRTYDGNPDSFGFDLTTLGLPAAYNDAIDPSIRRFPHITMANYAGTYGSGQLWGPTGIHILQGSFDKVLGNHTFKFGGEYRLYRENRYTYPNSTTGRFDFSGSWTRGPFDNSPAAPLGQDLASFLLGLPSGGFVDVNDSFAEQSTVTSIFLQDDWKVSRNLTVSLGLRYELEGPLTERHNRSVRQFDYEAALPIADQVQANYARNPTAEIPASAFLVRGGLAFAGVNGNPRTLFARDTNNFMPRIGIAYSHPTTPSCALAMASSMASSDSAAAMLSRPAIRIAPNWFRRSTGDSRSYQRLRIHSRTASRRLRAPR